METFTEADFAVGREVSMNGAQFLIYGCDEFTRDYYTKVHPSHTPLPTASRPPLHRASSPAAVRSRPGHDGDVHRGGLRGGARV